MKLRTIKTRNGNLLVKGNINDEYLYGFFTKKMEFIAPSDEDQWDNAWESWGTDIEEMEIDYIPFPFLRYLKNVLYAFYKEDHPKGRHITKRFLVYEEKKRTVYEKIDTETALYEKAGIKKQVWGRGAGENIKKSIIALSYNKGDEYKAVEIGVSITGTIEAIKYVCTKSNCNCDGAWWEEGEIRDIVAYFRIEDIELV